MPGDILQEIPDKDLPELLKFYEKYIEVTPQVYSFIKIAIKSKQIGFKNFVQVTSPNNSWKKDGTIIGIIRSNDLNYQIFLHTLDKDSKILIKGLKETKLIPLTGKAKGYVMFYGIYEKVNPALEHFLKHDKKLEFSEHGKWTKNFCMMPEIAVKLKPELPSNSEVFVDYLSIADAEIINSTWPHNSEGSVDFVRDLIKLNKGFGLYLKSNNQLVSWVCISVFGQMSLLYTISEQRGKGYGMFLILYTAKYLSEVEGIPAIGQTVIGNTAAKKLFQEAGFKLLHLANYIAVRM